MKDLFSGLEKFGLQLEDDITVFDEEKKKVKNEAGESVAVELREEDLLIDRIVKCPICEKKFKTKSVKSGKIKALESDKDLRPRYKELDVNKCYAQIVAMPHLINFLLHCHRLRKNWLKNRFHLSLMLRIMIKNVIYILMIWLSKGISLPC